ESSSEYYQIINETIKNKLGGFHSAKIIMYSIDFGELVDLLNKEKWNEIARLMIDAAQRVEKGGADFVVICSNTIHKVAEEIQNNVKIPLLHIVDLTAEEIKKQGLNKIGILGTRFTMEEDFYKGRLIDKYGFEVAIPGEEERKIVDNVIFNELCLGERKESSKKKFIEIIEKLVNNGAEGIILGCTEIPTLIRQDDIKVHLFNTTRIHAEAAAEYAIKQ
ncbi:unnamed protein product, partial [marine sediment metagenome]